MKILFPVLSALTLVACGDIASANTSRIKANEDRQAARDLGWVESKQDLKDIVALAKAGRPDIMLNSPDCDAKFNDALGVVACVNQVNLPSDVYLELRAMTENRFKNESDYDQSITRLYIFRHDGELAEGVLTEQEIEDLSVSFDIPSSLGKPYVRKVKAGSSEYLGMLKGVYTDKGYTEAPAAYRFVNGLVRGKALDVITWGTEVTLYPGGGFTTNFGIYISPKYLIFVKTEGWNS